MPKTEKKRKKKNVSRKGGTGLLIRSSIPLGSYIKKPLTKQQILNLTLDIVFSQIKFDTFSKRGGDQIIEAYNKSGKTLTVGFNRRFAPLAIQMKRALGSTDSPMNIIATMNAGFIPSKVWVNDMEIGGGRIIGEACHFIDLISYLCGSKVKSVCMNSMGINAKENTDNASILLKYENGTNAVINYFSNGSKAYSKERVEVYHQEKTLIMDNWRKLKGYGFKNFNSASSSQDKGHQNQFNLLINLLKNGGEQIIPFDDLINTTKASFGAIESFKNGGWFSL